MFRPADFGTFESFAHLASVLIETGNRASAELAAEYLANLAMVETGAVGMPPVIAPAPPLAVIATNLRANGLLGTLAGLRAGMSVQAAAANGWVRTAGTASSFVLHGSRDTTMATVRADPRITHWRRVSGGKTCDFCAMLISRGAVYKETTVDFRAHDHCGCVAEPEYRPVSAESRRIEAAWPEGQKSADALVTFKTNLRGTP